ncbi:gamma-glutamyl-gamma-aminobutyrate hydrolase family protein [Rickettsia endosymbiont of Orchestes rusci]|uniref:gamma-glutamyl-gamma-aminobutyrate hydrolase family protein n=1 Tax=Rickettsia endosymbiont of Orchestes rusci TaxID=3066250 RepID=UPI00313E1F63
MSSFWVPLYSSELTLEQAGISIDDARLLLSNIFLLHDKEYNRQSQEQLRKLLKDNFNEINSYEIDEKINEQTAEFILKSDSSPLNNIDKNLYEEILPYSTLLSKMFAIDEVVLANKLATYFSNMKEVKKYLEKVNYTNSETILWSFQDEQKPNFLSNVKPTIAISYNAEIGGATANEVKQRITEQGGNIISVDYRKITPLNTIDQPLEKILATAKAQAKKFLQNVDGLIIPGNSAAVYHELFDSNKDFGKTDKERSIAEITLLDTALQKGIPVVGICGGHQLINVYFGGKLANTHSNGLGYSNVIIDKDSELARIIAGKNSDTLTHHNFWASHKQVVSKIGDSEFLHPTAFAKDKIVATESKFGVPIKTFQFHPEVQAGQTEAELERNNEIFSVIVKTFNNYKLKKINLNNISKIEDNTPKDEISVKKLQNFSDLIKDIASINAAFTSKYSTIEEVEANSKLLQQTIISNSIKRDLCTSEIGLLNMGMTVEQFSLFTKMDAIRQKFLTENNFSIKKLIGIGISAVQFFNMDFDQQKFLIENNSKIKRLVKTDISIGQFLNMDFNRQKLFVENNSKIKKLIEIGISIEQFLNMDFNRQKLFIENNNDIKMLIEANISIEQLLAMDFDQQKLLVENNSGIKKFIGTSILLAMDETQQEFLIENNSSIKMLIGANISIEQFLNMNFDQQKFLIEKCHQVAILVKNGISIGQLFAMDATQQKFLIEKCYQVAILVKNGISIEQLFAMDATQQKFLIENSFGIKKLIEADIFISIEQLLAMNATQQKFLIENSFGIKKLIEIGLPIERLLAVDVTKQKFLIEKIPNIERLVKAGISMKKFFAMKFDQQKLFIEKIGEVVYLAGHGVYIEKLATINQQNLFIEKFLQVQKLAVFGSSVIELLINMDFNRQKLFIENNDDIKMLIEAGVDAGNLFAMEESQQKFFIKHCYHVKNLIKIGFSIPELFNLPETQQRLLIEKSYQVKNLVESSIPIAKFLMIVKAGIPIEELLNMDTDQQKFFLDEVDHSTQQLDIQHYELAVDMTGLTPELMTPAG